MPIRRFVKWFLFCFPWFVACQCSVPASAPLPWKGASCLQPRPYCAAKLLCENGLWKCLDCLSGEKQSCYTGPPGTVGVGTCKQGFQLCVAGVLSNCQEEIKPNAKDNCGDQLDDNCDGTVDDDCDCDPNGPERVCGQDIGLCKSGTQKCSPDGKWLPCIGWIQPQTEKCNNEDDDCDGQIDEDFKRGQLGPRGLGEACSEGTGACEQKGTYVCDQQQLTTVCSAVPKDPTNEICDNTDNNCDGQIDEGLTKNCYTGAAGTAGKGECKGGTQTCNAGKWSNCNGEIKPKGETCNNKDDDCDGQTDEGLTKPCYTGATGTAGKGECKGGTQTCQNGQWGQCSGEIKPKSEDCNNKDDDCDGQTDEGLTRPCKTLCGDGNETCKAGKWENCTAKQPKAEECNGQDDNCDGQVDEGLQRPCQRNTCPNAGKQLCKNGLWDRCDAAPCCNGNEKQKCYTGPQPTRNIGECKEGEQTCSNGEWGQCQGEITPQKKDCSNNKDNNCDGQIDKDCN